MPSSPGALSAMLIVAGCLSACAAPAPSAAAMAPTPPLRAGSPEFTQTGMASWYGRALHRQLTASGERFDMNDLTAAHRSLPLDTLVRVTNLANGRFVTVRINDRGPYVGRRVIDLSARAARVLGMREHGLARVRIEVFADDHESADTEPTSRMF
jgi:rare lipoprotein A (peptidoglycan hydrolase)